MNHDREIYGIGWEIITYPCGLIGSKLCKKLTHVPDCCVKKEFVISF